MILLKNRRLRVQLFVGFLLVLGAILEGSEGLQCFQCTSTGCIKENCEDEGSACMNITVGLQDADPGRSCAPEAEVTGCLDHLGYAKPGSSCGSVPLKEFVDKTSEGFNAKFEKCAKSNSNGRSLTEIMAMKVPEGESKLPDVMICLCKTDFCNADPDHPPQILTTPPPLNSEQQQTSSGKLIFTILTAAFYIYM